MPSPFSSNHTVSPILETGTTPASIVRSSPLTGSKLIRSVTPILETLLSNESSPTFCSVKKELVENALELKSNDT